MEEDAGTVLNAPKQPPSPPSLHSSDKEAPKTPDSEFHEEEEIENDGPDDIEQGEQRPELTRLPSAPPYSIFSHRAKLFIVISVSVSSLISPFGATTFYPALNVLAKDLNVTPTLINLALTAYMVSPSIPECIGLQS